MLFFSYCDTFNCIRPFSVTFRAKNYTLKFALKKEKIEELIHHSDRGLQYCSDDYQKVLNQYNIRCSMTQESDPYQNAIAERINGILKQEYDIDKFNVNLQCRKKLVADVVKIYNEKRPHFSNHFLTPKQMHTQQELVPKLYKRKSDTVGKTVPLD
ncbi:transposase [Capnocytophaga canimorsus]